MTDHEDHIMMQTSVDFNTGAVPPGRRGSLATFSHNKSHRHNVPLWVRVDLHISCDHQKNQHGQWKVVDRKQISELHSQCVYIVTDQLDLHLVSVTNVHYF